MRRFPAGVVAVALLVACGGSDGPTNREEWLDRHGATVNAVGMALDQTQAATKEGEPVAIRTSCESLRDSVQEAKETLPVPDDAADEALRKALDSMATGAADCVKAMGTGDARLLERSITKLREARLQLDTAYAELD